MANEKKVYEMLYVSAADISDKKTLKNLKLEKKDTSIEIDTIVNAADPTLMGSNNPATVDYKVHQAIDDLLKKQYKGNKKKHPKTFNEMICKELSVIDGGRTVGNPEEKRIRCTRGNAVLTKGYGLCSYVIHVVGARYDGDISKKKECSNSRVRTLESCYYKMVEIIRSHPDIKNVAIPIISSGNYGFPFEFAVKIAVTSIGNALLDWQSEDIESFETASIENIVFFTDPNRKKINAGSLKSGGEDEENECQVCVQEIIEEYSEIFKLNHHVVFRKSYQSQKQYIKEVKEYDEVRGYFSIAQRFRLWLLRLRVVLGLLSNFIKDIVGGEDWQKRRCVVEITALIKMFFPCILWGVVRYCDGVPECVIMFCTSLLCYSTADTVTYLMVLLFLADIQRSSANVIRSMLLLLFNYIEVSLTMSYLYYLYNLYGKGRIACRIALEYGVMGNIGTGEMLTLKEYFFLYSNTALKFFFITLVFGYIAGHLSQRSFKAKKQ